MQSCTQRTGIILVDKYIGGHEPLTHEIALVLAVLVIAIILFATEKLRVDVISMMVLLSLLLLGLVDIDEAFSGFSSPAVITVWAIYIVSAGLFRTGVADFIGQRILSVAGSSEPRLIGVIMLAVGTMSAFMNNIGATAVLLPAVSSIARRVKTSPSKLLIPLSFGSLLGGVTTLIGTPPNLLVSNALYEANLQPFGLLDYAPMGLIIMFSGIVYMVVAGRHLLPARQGTTDLTGSYQVRDYLTEVRVQPGSPLVNKTVVESRFGQDYDLNIVSRRGNQLRLPDLGKRRLPSSNRRRLTMRRDERIQEGDVLVVRGNLDTILKIKERQGLEIVPDVELSDAELTTEETAIAEVLIPTRSELVGKSLKEIAFRDKYNLTVLALWRHGEPIRRKLADAPLDFADVLLVQGRRDRINLLRTDPNFLLLEPVELETRRTHKAPLALGIFGIMLGSVIIGWLHISAAAVLGAILMVLTRCLTMEEAYEAIEWKSVFLIAGMLPMGVAMGKTGTAQFLADHIIAIVGPLGPQMIMVGLFILTTIVTEFMSNAAAAVLVAPIAISAALGLGADPRAFVMGVGIAASNSFLFPIGHQANVLIFGPGGYKFFDFTRVGLPLTLLIWLLLILFLPVIWPLY
jgi:di/tricarboxylate transporter